MKAHRLKNFWADYREAKKLHDYIMTLDGSIKQRKLTFVAYIWVLFTMWLRETTCRHQYMESARTGGPGYCYRCGKIL